MSPYYISKDQQVDLTGKVPWLQLSNAALLNHWTNSETFQRNYFKAFASDLIYSEISSICSVFLIVSRTTGEKGRENGCLALTILNCFSDKKLVSWFHHKLLRPVIGDLIESCCYNYIWTLANTITDSQIKSLQKYYYFYFIHFNFSLTDCMIMTNKMEHFWIFSKIIAVPLLKLSRDLNCILTGNFQLIDASDWL